MKRLLSEKFLILGYKKIYISFRSHVRIRRKFSDSLIINLTENPSLCFQCDWLINGWIEVKILRLVYWKKQHKCFEFSSKDLHRQEHTSKGHGIQDKIVFQHVLNSFFIRSGQLGPLKSKFSSCCYSSYDFICSFVTEKFIESIFCALYTYCKCQTSDSSISRTT